MSDQFHIPAALSWEKQYLVPTQQDLYQATEEFNVWLSIFIYWCIFYLKFI
jgi:hypothetical protein